MYIMLWAVCCVCFFGFFRLGEIVARSPTGDELDLVLRFEDIEVNREVAPTLVQFTLRASKTDPFRKGVKVAIG